MSKYIVSEFREDLEECIHEGYPEDEVIERASPVAAAEAYFLIRKSGSCLAEDVGLDVHDPDVKVKVFVLDVERKEIDQVEVSLEIEVTYHANGRLIASSGGA